MNYGRMRENSGSHYTMQMRSKQHAGEVAKRQSDASDGEGARPNKRSEEGDRFERANDRRPRSDWVLGWARHERGWRRDPPPTPGSPASLEVGLGAERLGLS